MQTSSPIRTSAQADHIARQILGSLYAQYPLYSLPCSVTLII